MRRLFYLAKTRPEKAQQTYLVLSLFLSLIIIIAVSFSLKMLESVITKANWGVETASAVVKQVLPDYKAEKYSKIESLDMKPGELRQIKIGFYNRGGYNWRRTGENYISLYTYGPKYRASVFANSHWVKSTQPAKLMDSLSGPNELGYFELWLQAPKKKGVYKETFALAAENKAWISNGQFTLTITVKDGSTTDVEGNGDIASIVEEANYVSPPKIQFKTKKLEAMRLTRVEALQLKPGEVATVAVMYINKGKNSWKKRSLALKGVAIATAGSPASFATESWADTNTVAASATGEVKTGQTEIYQIPLLAPSMAGIYTLRFALSANNELLEGGSLDLPVTVTSEEGNPSPGAPVSWNDEGAPKIRVGLYTTEEPVKFISPAYYQAQDSEGTALVGIEPGERAIITYSETKKLYTLQTAKRVLTSAKPIKLVPTDAHSVFTLEDFANRPRWNLELNDNQYRGGVEVRVSDTGFVWVINEILLEDYLKGLAEAGDSSPTEFLKALQTAARSYAYYHLQNPTKHAAGGFILDADNDQVYRGYGQEVRSSNITAAVEATAGMIITYEGQPVVTPFFGRSNGKTKSFKAVWGGASKPWLVPVVCPYDKGYSQWGHGVGMSARDAIYRAKAGANWEDILKYYYTGVELQKMY